MASKTAWYTKKEYIVAIIGAGALIIVALINGFYQINKNEPSKDLSKPTTSINNTGLSKVTISQNHDKGTIVNLNDSSKVLMPQNIGNGVQTNNFGPINYSKQIVKSQTVFTGKVAEPKLDFFISGQPAVFFKPDTGAYKTLYITLKNIGKADCKNINVTIMSFFKMNDSLVCAPLNSELNESSTLVPESARQFHATLLSLLKQPVQIFIKVNYKNIKGVSQPPLTELCIAKYGFYNQELPLAEQNKYLEIKPLLKKLKLL